MYCYIGLSHRLVRVYGLQYGDIAQLARAVALQAIGQGFESPYLQFCFFEINREGKRRCVICENNTLKFKYTSFRRTKRRDNNMVKRIIGLWWMPKGAERRRRPW